MNLYGYGDGDPVNNADPFGLFPGPAVCLVTPGACVAVVVGGVRAALGLYRAAKSLANIYQQASESLEGGGSETEPTLPEKEIASEDGVTIDHNYRGGDHGPAHLHVSGGGGVTRIGQNGKPLKGQPELSPQQKRVVDRHKTEVRRAVGKIGRWLAYKERNSP